MIPSSSSFSGCRVMCGSRAWKCSPCRSWSTSQPYPASSQGHQPTTVFHARHYARHYAGDVVCTDSHRLTASNFPSTYRSPVQLSTYAYRQLVRFRRGLASHPRWVAQAPRTTWIYRLVRQSNSGNSFTHINDPYVTSLDGSVALSFFKSVLQRVWPCLRLERPCGAASSSTSRHRQRSDLTATRRAGLAWRV